MEAVKVLYGYNNFSILPNINLRAATNCKHCEGVKRWKREYYSDDPSMPKPPLTMSIKALELIGRKNRAMIRHVSTMHYEELLF